MAINRRRCKPASGQKRTLQCKKPCPLWASRGHMQRKQACPLYPQKQTPLGIFACGDEGRWSLSPPVAATRPFLKRRYGLSTQGAGHSLLPSRGGQFLRAPLGQLPGQSVYWRRQYFHLPQVQRGGFGASGTGGKNIPKLWRTIRITLSSR